MRDINFFSSYINEKKISRKKFLSTAIIFIVISLIICGLTFINIFKEKQLQNEIIAVQAELSNEEIDKKLDMIEDKKRKIEILTKHYEIVKKINTEINSIDLINSNLLETISACLPKEIFIKGMSMNTDSIQLQGIAKNRIAVAELEYNLKQTHMFYAVHVNILSNEFSNSDNYQFNIECTFFKDVKNYETN
ncbi:PilN domain-containing protein [Crassaminicella indica]|uniref:PilN domain-containing protein n=1 Tax=Crassaminicella indica TaxID=2855394 RepID=A0ABX8RAD0_9CLOT|nr:PilN domain-containing protein [Crassaminicella indica]QXM05997.1 PilN domain-containing protein [Crassaminicella indica]